MAKLFTFSMEDAVQQAPEDDELLIDKVIRKDKIDPNSPLVSEELKKQRAELKVQIENSINQAAEAVEEEQETDDNTGDQETSDEEPEGQDTEDGEDAPQEGSQQATQQTVQQTSQDAKPEEEEKEEPDDKGDEKKDDKKDSEESLESYFSPRKTKKLSMANVNKGINRFMSHYTSEIQGVKRKGFSFEELPMAYVKDELLEFLTKVTTILDKSISETSENLTAHEKGFLLLNEKLMMLKADIGAGKKKFTDGATVTTDMLLPMAVKTTGEVNAVESSEIVLEANKVLASILQLSMGKDLNAFYDILLKNSFVASDSKNEYRYKTLLPGLTDIRFSLFPFKSYLSDDLDETEFFAVKNTTQANKEGIYENNIEQPEAAVHLLELALECVTASTVTLDHLRKVVTAMNGELSNVKVTVQDIQSGTVSEIKAEKINQLVKTVMLYRLLASYASGLDNINILYLTGSLSYVSARYVS